MSVTERAWAAGFFDGEGCTSVSHRKAYRGQVARTQLFLVVTQCGPEAPFHLNRFRNAVGQLGWVAAPIKPSTGTLDQYRWQIGSSSGALQVMRHLWPYLGPTKKRQFIKALRESVRDFRHRRANGSTRLRLSH